MSVEGQSPVVLTVIGLAENAVVFVAGAIAQGLRNKKKQAGRRDEAVRALVTAIGALLPHLVELETTLRRMDAVPEGTWLYFMSDGWPLDAERVDRLARAVDRAATLSQVLSTSSAAAADAVREAIRQRESIRSLMRLDRSATGHGARGYQRQLVIATNCCRKVLDDARTHAADDSRREIDRLLSN